MSSVVKYVSINENLQQSNVVDSIVDNILYYIMSMMMTTHTFCSPHWFDNL